MKLSKLSKLSKYINLKNVLLIILIIIILIIGYKVVFSFKESFSPKVIRGFFLPSYGGYTSPAGTWDIGILFSGETPKDSIDKHINESSKITATKKLLSVGGGNNTGIWNGTASIDYVSSKLSDIKNAGWDGLCFDIEVCTPNVDFVNTFSKCFAACKAANLMVIVNTSHAMPWSCQSGKGQGADLINSWITDPSIDYLSPALYGADGTTLDPFDLSKFQSIESKILPAIPYDTDWAKLNSTNIKIAPTGFLMWKIPPPAVNTNFCGKDWGSTSCSKPCPNLNECSNGESCYAGVTKCTGASTHSYCGADWGTANVKCGVQCSKGESCPTGQSCYADLNNCPANTD